MENADFSYLNNEILENLTREEKKHVEISKEIAKDVEARNLTVLEAIQKLECLLTSQSFTKREMGVLILSETLHNLDLSSNLNNLSSEQLVVLSSYFSEKLKDHHQVAIAALKGILALTSSSDVPSESVVLLVASIFNHITCQQQQQQDRYLIFQIYESFLNKHIKDVHYMGIDFVYGVISSIDGERDPKNLLYLFVWLQTFLKNVKLGHLKEEMFEVLACYFPVDFKAPPSDKNKISREDLATSLCQCLTCIPDFGPYCIPLALEKLDSALKIAKEDSLGLLKSGCKSYETTIYFQHSVEIWSQIQKEIFSTSDAGLRQSSLETLREIIRKLSEGDPKQFKATVNDISDTLKGNLLPESKLFYLSSKILIFVAQASHTSSVIVTKKVAPFLENTFKINKNPEHKGIILNTFIAFVRAVIINNTNTDLSSFEEIASTPILCLQATLDLNESLRIEGFRGFIEIAQFIPENVRKLFFANIHRLIVIPQKEEVKQSFFQCLEKISEIYVQEVEEQVLYKEKICELDVLDMYLESLSSILNVPYFRGYVMDTLMTYILESVDFGGVALRHLNNILVKNIGMDRVLVETNFLYRLTDFLSKLEYPEDVQDEYLNNANLVFQNTVRNQDTMLQKELYLSQSTKGFKSRRVFMTVLSGLIVPMKKDVFDDFEKIPFLLDCSMNGNDDFARTISLEVLANVLNKIDNEEVLIMHLNKIETLCDNCSNIDTRVMVITWITKSLVLRNHPNAWRWTDKLIHCLDDNVEATKGFRIIMDESYPAVSKRNYCQIMSLYKQKFFIYVTNKISENSPTNKPKYFTLVGYMLENAPRQAITGQFKKILRLILLSLEKCAAPDVLHLILQRITHFVASGEAVIENSFEDIFLRILNLTSFEKSMKVRILAVECIRQFTMAYPLYKLLPFKQKVIYQLGRCIDDKKRLVRREAMACRSLWYLLDAPE